MIVVDESIESGLIIQAIAAWYPGQVLSIRKLRPGTLVKDDAVDTLLAQINQPTFVTINVDDFWYKMPVSRRYCVIAVEMMQSQALQLPTLLRHILTLAEFRTKANRMGKMIRVRPTAIDYYEHDRQVHTCAWSNPLRN